MQLSKIASIRNEIARHLKSPYVISHQRRFNAYKGEDKAAIIETLQRVAPNTYTKIDPVWLNITRVVVDRRAGKLYDVAPKRAFYQNGEQVGDDMQTELEGFLKACGFDIAMDKASRYTFNHKTVLAHAEPREGYPKVDILPPHAFYIKQGTPDPTRLEDAEYVAVVLKDYYRVWTDEQWVDIEVMAGEAKQSVVNKGENVYERLPMVVLHAEDPDRTIYVEGGSDLETVNNHLGLELSDTGFIARLSSFGVPVIKGQGVDELTVSPDEAIKLPAEGDFDFAAPPALLTERLQRANALLSQLAVTYQLPADEFQPNKAPTSGISRRIMSAQLVEAREAWARRMAKYENDVFQLLVSVYNTLSEKRLPEGLSLRTVFAPQTLPLDPTEQATLDKMRLDMGVISPVDIIMRDRGIGEDEAREIYQRNQVDARDMRKAQANIPTIGGR